MMGEWRYELVDDWEQLPKGYRHRTVPDVSVDSHDRIYAFTRKDPRVIVYERDGTFVRSWGEDLFTPRTHGITVGPDDLVYCVDDTDQTVRKFTPEGKLLMTIGKSRVASDTGYDITKATSVEKMLSIKHGGPPFNRPTDVAIAPSGELYVSDGYGNARVHRFSADGKLIQSWGEPGIGPGQFYTPHGVSVTADGRVLVADRHNDRIQVFSLAGEFQEQWTNVQRPSMLFIDRAGLIYVAEAEWLPAHRSMIYGVRDLPPRVCVLDNKGKLLSRWTSVEGGGLGKFTSAHGICVDSHGDLYLASNNNSGLTHATAADGGAPREDYYTLRKFARK